MGGAFSTASPTPTQLPEKNTFAHLKEHEYDDHPVWDAPDLPFTPTRIDIEKILQGSQEELKELGDKLIAGLKKDTFVVLKAPSGLYQETQDIREEIKSFFSLSDSTKKKVAAPELENGKRGYYSGYSPLFFENRHNRRDKEWRDVFQLRLYEEGHIPWPSETFKEVAVRHYLSQWKLCIHVLRSLAISFGIEESVFMQLLNSSNISPEPSPQGSANTNLCFFHYYDKLQAYRSPQKCMVHNDYGILTLLPRTDLPGLEIFHPDFQQWFSVERYVQDDEILLYAGIATSIVTNSAIPAAFHRVVRQPKSVRFSMPFELKPNDEAQLIPMFPVEGKSEYQTFDSLQKEMQWTGLMRTVRRSDGIEPGSEEEKRALEQISSCNEGKMPAAHEHEALEVC
jgi:isopenicillin N synthase-like dioxygenase